MHSRRFESHRVYGALQRHESAFGAEGVSHSDVVCLAGQRLDYLAVTNHRDELAVSRSEDQRTVIEPAAAPQTYPVAVNGQCRNKDNRRAGERRWREHRSSGFEQAERAGCKRARHVFAPAQRTWPAGLRTDDRQQQPGAPFTQASEHVVGAGFGPHRHIGADRVADVNGIHGVCCESESLGRPYRARNSAAGGQQSGPELSFSIDWHMVHHGSADATAQLRRQIRMKFVAESRSVLRLGRHGSLGW